MTRGKLIIDVKGKEIHVGNRVRFATWGMFDVWLKDKQNSGRKSSDPEYVTHTDLGTVEKLLDEESGCLNIIPDGISGMIHLCTRPSWGARPEFIEVID